MKALTAIAATLYAVTLWLFAPKSLWERELEAAKRNQQQRSITSEPIQQPISKATSEEEPTALESLTEDYLVITDDEVKELLSDTFVSEETAAEQPDESIPESQQDYTALTTNQLRELAKRRKLNWRPLVNGKRTPLKKPELIELLLTA